VTGVITLIKDDHAKLESVFKKLESAEPSEVRDLLQEVAELLIPHSKAEEQVVYPAIKSAVPGEDSDVDDGIAEHHHVEEVLEELMGSDPEAPGVNLGEQFTQAKERALTALQRLS
jgi:hemerythrin superfamily protein